MWPRPFWSSSVPLNQLCPFKCGHAPLCSSTLTTPYLAVATPLLAIGAPSAPPFSVAPPMTAVPAPGPQSVPRVSPMALGLSLRGPQGPQSVPKVPKVPPMALGLSPRCHQWPWACPQGPQNVPEVPPMALGLSPRSPKCHQCPGPVPKVPKMSPRCHQWPWACPQSVPSASPRPVPPSPSVPRCPPPLTALSPAPGPRPPSPRATKVSPVASLRRWLRAELRLDLEAGGHRLRCLLCSCPLPSLHLGDIRRHALAAHPDTLRGRGGHGRDSAGEQRQGTLGTKRVWDMGGTLGWVAAGDNGDTGGGAGGFGDTGRGRGHRCWGHCGTSQPGDREVTGGDRSPASPRCRRGGGGGGGGRGRRGGGGHRSPPRLSPPGWGQQGTAHGGSGDTSDPPPPQCPHHTCTHPVSPPRCHQHPPGVTLFMCMCPPHFLQPPHLVHDPPINTPETPRAMGTFGDTGRVPGTFWGGSQGHSGGLTITEGPSLVAVFYCGRSSAGGFGGGRGGCSLGGLWEGLSAPSPIYSTWGAPTGGVVWGSPPSGGDFGTSLEWGGTPKFPLPHPGVYSGFFLTRPGSFAWILQREGGRDDLGRPQEYGEGGGVPDFWGGVPGILGAPPEHLLGHEAHVVIYLHLEGGKWGFQGCPPISGGIPFDFGGIPVILGVLLSLGSPRISRQDVGWDKTGGGGYLGGTPPSVLILGVTTPKFKPLGGHGLTEDEEGDAVENGSHVGHQPHGEVLGGPGGGFGGGRGRRRRKAPNLQGIHQILHQEEADEQLQAPVEVLGHHGHVRLEGLGGHGHVQVQVREPQNPHPEPQNPRLRP
ncbi:hypothetical protein DV515_00018863 [Chloebia gouldiae]|uniref:SPIN-DOC-like zinc-finger domain-containing protein n=1 Tax=Chloebia gouldiae TaxID=44316 RepID=A0A3L8Q6B2_CHLGU|nr:hypothetical protein DV515_00018863 [Chloebia gouldiae]